MCFSHDMAHLWRLSLKLPLDGDCPYGTEANKIAPDGMPHNKIAPDGTWQNAASHLWLFCLLTGI